MLLPWVPFLLFFLGLCVGSFVNVLTFRFGFSETASPRSLCMACDKQIAWYDLVPVLSYAALSGRCRECGSGLSIQYPLVELGVGALFLFAFLIVPPLLSFFSILAFAALLTFLAALVGLVAYDIRHTLVPMPFLYALIAAAAVAAAAQSAGAGSLLPIEDAAAGGAALFLFFMALFLGTRGKGMGEGDAYAAAAIGIMLGFFRGIEAVMIGVWSATIIALLLLALSKKRVTMKTEVPLIPFLAFGFLVALYTDFSPLSLVAPLANLFIGHL